MTNDRNLTIRTRWDSELVPAGRMSERNLLLEITAPSRPEPSVPRQPINLALVIDRSGSMRGMRIEAAKRAAMGIAEALGESDRLSIVIFDNVVDVLLDGRSMGEGGRREAMELIGRIRSGATTDMAGGWAAGARCAATVDETSGITGGHVLVLSDGFANQGNCDPNELMRHAHQLAVRGIKTSCVGIGEGYSPLQLDALAEGGMGRLHDSQSAQDICEVVLGELGELHAITALNVRLKLQYPEAIRLDVLTQGLADDEPGICTVDLGDMAGGATRELALRAELPALGEGAELPFTVLVEWQQVGESQLSRKIEQGTRLYVVPAAKAAAAATDLEVVERVANLWEAALAYRAMRQNELGDFAGAGLIYAQQRDGFADFVSELPSSSAIIDRFGAASERVSREWGGRSKRRAYTASRKVLNSERELRSRDQGAWHENLGD